MLDTTSLAAIEFYGDSGKYYRVFYQNEDNSIKISEYDSQKNWYAREGSVVSDAKKGTPIAVSHWNRGTEVRLYYLNTANKISEVVGKAKNTGDVFTWTKGDADLSHAEPANNSQLAVARPKKDDEVLRVFYQKKTNDNTLGEVVYTKQRKRWQVGTTKFPQALSGSGLSAISAKPAGEVRLYYQGTDKKLKEHFLATNGVWAATDLPDYPLTPASKISVLLWGTNQDQPELQIRVYAADQNKNVVQITYDDGSWDDQIKVYGKTYSTNDVSAAALSASRRVDGPQEKIAIFYQAEGNAIVELSVDTQAIVPKGLPTSL